MSITEDIIQCIQLRLLVNINYNGRYRTVAPLVLGKINRSLKLLSLHVGGYSESKLDGTSESDWRLYTVSDILNAEPTLVDFNVKADPDYLTKKFDSVTAVVEVSN